ncbi:MAG: hypothetical protein ACTHW2_12035 [Tissierella sp.]
MKNLYFHDTILGVISIYNNEKLLGYGWAINKKRYLLQLEKENKEI